MDDDEDVDDFNKETKLLGQDLEKYEQNKFGSQCINYFRNSLDFGYHGLVFHLKLRIHAK